jgi:hypothetical protein
MPSTFPLTQQIKELARATAVDTLSQSPTFKGLPVNEQREIYMSLVQEEINRLAAPNMSVSKAMASNDSQRASDMIDEKRHQQGMSQTVADFGDLVDTVDFPKFVKDLLKGVFDANINVMHAQTQDYIKLMQAATKDLSSYVKNVKDDEAIMRLAEKGGNYNISMEEGEDEKGNPTEKMTLVKPNGEQMSDNELKARLMEMKIEMAKEQRAILREVILMGVTRLVVEKGEVEAKVLFEMSAHRETKRADKAMAQTERSSGSNYGGGISLPFFGGGGGGRNESERQTKLSVASTKSASSDDLKGKLEGRVKIQFKTDYFKLDNFASMYGPVTNQQGGQGQAAPPQQQQPQPQQKR